MDTYFIDSIRKTVKYWWVSVLSGILSIILGIWCIATPLATFEALLVVFTISFFIKGVLEITFAISNRAVLRGWGWQLLLGAVDVIFGIILISSPVVAGLTLIFVVAFWIMFQSILSLGISIDLASHKVPGAGLSVITSVLGLLLAFVLLWNPNILGSFIVYLISFSFIFYGIARIYIGIQLKKISKEQL